MSCVPGGEPPPAEGAQVKQLSKRAASVYVGAGAGLLVVVLVIIFVLQNLADAKVHFLWAHVKLPIGVLVLASAVAGGIIVLLGTGVRLTQARRATRRRARHHLG